MKTSAEKPLRVVLGLFLMAYALNQFFHIFPTSYGAMPEITRNFLDAVVVFLPFLYVFEIVTGLLLVFNKWSSLILIMIFPLSLAFLMFNLVNGDFAMMWPALFVAGMNVSLLVLRREAYLSLLD